MKDILLADIVNLSAGMEAAKAVIVASLIVLGISWIFYIIGIALEHRYKYEIACEVCYWVWLILFIASMILLVPMVITYLVGSFELDQMILSYEAVYGPLPGGVI